LLAYRAMSEGAMLATSLQGARAETDALFRLLAPDAIYDRPIPERNRLVFYLGHLEAFDWNQIGRVCLDMPSLRMKLKLCCYHKRSDRTRIKSC